MGALQFYFAHSVFFQSFNVRFTKFKSNILSINPFALLALVGGGLYVAARWSTTARNESPASKNIQLGIQTVKFSMNFATPIATVIVAIQNFSSVPVVVNSIDANCFLNGKYAGKATLIKNVVAPANLQSGYPVEVRMTVADMWQELQRIMRGEVAAGAEIKLQGNITIDSVSHPINLVYKIV